MALIGLNITATKRVELDLDPEKGKPGATNFIIGALDCYLLAEMNDSLAIYTDLGNEGQATRTRIQSTAIRIVKFGLKGWDNFLGADGVPIPFSTTKEFVNGKEYVVVSDETLRLLPLELILELSRKIREANSITVTEAKKPTSV